MRPATIMLAVLAAAACWTPRSLAGGPAANVYSTEDESTSAPQTESTSVPQTESASVPQADSTSAPRDDLGAIRGAADADAATTAYAEALQEGAPSPALREAYVRKLVQLARPDLAFAQAALWANERPTAGFPWGVLAYVNADRGNYRTALRDLVNAVGRLPKDPFVVRTAGQLLALYDAGRIDAKAVSPEMMKGLDGIRARYSRNHLFIEAYEEAADAYAKLPQVESKDETAAAAAQVPAQPVVIQQAPPPVFVINTAPNWGWGYGWGMAGFYTRPIFVSDNLFLDSFHHRRGRFDGDRDDRRGRFDGDRDDRRSRFDGDQDGHRRERTDHGRSSAPIDTGLAALPPPPPVGDQPAVRGSRAPMPSGIRLGTKVGPPLPERPAVRRVPGDGLPSPVKAATLPPGAVPKPVFATPRPTEAAPRIDRPADTEGIPRILSPRRGGPDPVVTPAPGGVLRIPKGDPAPARPTGPRMPSDAPDGPTWRIPSNSPDGAGVRSVPGATIYGLPASGGPGDVVPYIGGRPAYSDGGRARAEATLRPGGDAPRREGAAIPPWPARWFAADMCH